MRRAVGVHRCPAHHASNACHFRYHFDGLPRLSIKRCQTDLVKLLHDLQPIKLPQLRATPCVPSA